MLYTSNYNSKYRVIKTTRVGGNDAKLIYINGASGSGKTTLGLMLHDKLNKSYFIDQDKFYKKDKPSVNFEDDNGTKYTSPNWDCTDAIDFDALILNIKDAMTKYDYVIVSGFALRLDSGIPKPNVSILLDYNMPADKTQEQIINTRLQSKKIKDNDKDKWMVKKVLWPFYEETLTKIGNAVKIPIFSDLENLEKRRSKDELLDDIMNLISI